MRSITRVLALVCVLALLGCGGGGSKAGSSDSKTDQSDTSQSDARSAKELAADQKLADATVLTLADFPAGWQGKPREASTTSADEKAAAATFGTCLGVDPAIIADDDESDEAKAKSDKFSDGDLSVEASASVGSTADEQKSVLKAFKKPEAKDCFATFFSAAIKSELENPGPGKTVPKGVTFGDLGIDDLDLPGIHGDVVAFRTTSPVTVQGTTITVNVDFVLALEGRTGMTFTFTNVGSGFPKDLEVELSNAMIDRAPTS
jgi:hypothetical protein